MGMTPWQHGIVQIEIISVERALEDVLSVEAVVVGSLFVIRRLSRWTHTYRDTKMRQFYPRFHFFDQQFVVSDDRPMEFLRASSFKLNMNWTVNGLCEDEIQNVRSFIPSPAFGLG